jgi:hypothetical protein
MRTPLKVVLFLSFCTTAFSQRTWQDYVGIYFLDSAEVKDFHNFYSFRLEPADYWKYMDTSRCLANWWPTDTVNKDIDVDTMFVMLYLEHDSIYFRTAECFNEQYAFSGRFRLPASQFADHLAEPILDGVLQLYRRGICERQSKVTFTYEFGGD